MTNENWIRTSTLKEFKNQAKKAVTETNAKHQGMRQVTIPHPTFKRTFILKYV